MKINRTMDLGEAMQIWKKELGGTISSWDRKDGYHCLFIRHGQVQGFTKASAGGIYWEWPDELLKYEAKRLHKLEEEAREQELEEENYKFGAGEEFL